MGTISNLRLVGRAEHERSADRWAGTQPWETRARSHLEALGELREGYNLQSMRNVRMGDGSRRLVAYAAVRPGESTVVALATARRFAEREGHQVVREIADATGPLAPCRRPGYLEARRLVLGGYAEGLVVPSMAHISGMAEEYEEQIRDLGERFALMLLANPETTA
ncbi:hypothetical protein [Streptomyces sp. IGB124]|uniref:hypothetical protein n=1 Tax=Streptomyces sp. IGB124 TaxID=1519485 RepID=UPI0006AFD96F|nr:hypothetical protein [Streptomyces sp. IGB124]KOU62123.1 hypothetical protein ADK96_27305 [Streptomyces sp. IGB124]